CPAIVIKDEAFDNIKQALFIQHAVQQGLGIQAGFILLRIALPLDKMFPLARDRAVAGLVTVAYYKKSIVIESVRNAVLAHVVGEIVVKSGADVAVNGFQFDKDQRQAVDQADEVSTAIVMRHAQTLDAQFANGKEAVIPQIFEVDHL